jgi:glucose-6-phosphate-specific signal transduction histidine kinase
VAGDRRTVSTFYRIVQEALTNVIKHAGGAPSQVVLRWSDAALELEIIDQGTPSDGAPQQMPAGRGVTGMRERAAMYLARAADMYLSEATVKTHVSRILAKLELRDRVQAVVLAYEEGLVEPGTV